MASSATTSFTVGRLVTDVEHPAAHGLAYLLDELQVGRHARVGPEVEADRLRQQFTSHLGNYRGRRLESRPLQAQSDSGAKCGITSVPMSSIVCMTDSCEILYGFTRHSSRSTPAAS